VEARENQQPARALRVPHAACKEITFQGRRGVFSDRARTARAGACRAGIVEAMPTGSWRLTIRLPEIPAPVPAKADIRHRGSRLAAGSDADRQRRMIIGAPMMSWRMRMTTA